MSSPVTAASSRRPCRNRQLLVSLCSAFLLWFCVGCDSWDTLEQGIAAESDEIKNPNGQFAVGFGVGFAKGGFEIIELGESVTKLVGNGGAELWRLVAARDWNGLQGKLNDLYILSLDGAIAIGEPVRELIDANLTSENYLAALQSVETARKGITALIDDLGNIDLDKAIDATEAQIKELEKYASQEKVQKLLADAFAKIEEQIKATSFEEVYAALALGDWETILGKELADKIPEALRIGLMHAIDFMEFAGAELAGIKPYEKGIIVGYIAFQFVPLSKAKDALKGTARLLKINQKATKLKGMGIKGIDRVLAAWKNHVSRIEKDGWCFSAGTAVLVPDGSKPIAEIQIGDLVLTADEATGVQKFAPVTDVHVSHVLSWCDLELVSPQQLHGVDLDELVDTTLISTTPEHPIWSEDAQAFVPSASLQPGDTVRLHDGTYRFMWATSTRPNTTGALAYNLSVADGHTYFVSDIGVWVHNQTPRCQVMMGLCERFIKRGIPLKKGGALNFSDDALKAMKMDETGKLWFAAQHIFANILGKNKTHKFDQTFVKAVNAAFARRAGTKWYRPPSQTKLKWNSTPRPDACDAAHYWPQRWMRNPSQARYDQGQCFIQGRPVHTRRIPTVVGNDPILDDWMLQELQKVAPKAGGQAFVPTPTKSHAEQIKEAIAWFKNQKNLDDSNRVSLIQRFWRDELAIDPPAGMGIDGIIP